MSQSKIEVICPLCGQKKIIVGYSPSSVYDIENEYMIVDCEACEVAHTTPLPTPQVLADIYSMSYGYEVHSIILKEKELKARQIVAYIGKNKRILDYGCSYGVLLDQAKKNGNLTFGVEINKKISEILRKKGHIIYQKIEDVVDNKFDIIVFNHSLEHILDLEDEFRKVTSFLSHNGQIIVLVPNYKSFWRRVYKKSWGWYQQPVHIWHFSINGLRTFFKKNGFNLVQNKFLPGDSLLVLLTLRNAFLSKSISDRQLSKLTKIAVKCFSFVWIFIGRVLSKDEIFIVLKK